MLKSAMVSGFTAVGMQVFQVGPMPTPAVAMLTKSMLADVGVMISASHNLFEDNGIKLFGPDGYKLSNETEAEIERLIDEAEARPAVRGNLVGRAKRIESAAERYAEFVKGR
jgi:phosphoglucosamine mutase